MELRMIGLGRLGGNMALRLLKAGHRVVAYDLRAESVQALAAQGATGASPTRCCGPGKSRRRPRSKHTSQALGGLRPPTRSWPRMAGAGSRAAAPMKHEEG